MTKAPIAPQGHFLAEREKRWYRAAQEKNLRNLPEIIAWDPLTMRKVEGKHPFELDCLLRKQRAAVLESIFAALECIHSSWTQTADMASLEEAYPGKTRCRLERVKRLIPFANTSELVINGRTCPNPLFRWDELEAALRRYYPANFAFIHGDCTFSNTFIDASLQPIFIDPRGYFGNTELLGDPAYDYAKLWYSMVGNYDQFNRRNFRLKIEGQGVWFSIASNGWEELTNEFSLFLPPSMNLEYIRLLHGIIWLSLTTYVWDDYDSICCAFYNGTHFLREVFDGNIK